MLFFSIILSAFNSLTSFLLLLFCCCALLSPPSIPSMEAPFQYQKLKPEEGLDVRVDGHGQQCYKTRFRPIQQRSLSRFWPKLRRVPFRRRLRTRVPRLRRFLRRKVRLAAAAVRKAMRRLKDGQGHLGDLLVGNYLFLQVSPSTPVVMRKFTVERSIHSSRFSATHNPPI